MADFPCIYEQQYFQVGWFDHSGLGMPAWFDREIQNPIVFGGPFPDIPIVKINLLEPPFLDDDDVIFPLDGSPGTPIAQLPPGFPPTAGIWVELTAGFFDDEDLIFSPIAVRALTKPDQMLKNEVRRIR